MKITRALPTMTPELNRFVERFLGPMDFPETRVFEAAWTPAIDLTESEAEFVARLEAPGVHKENLDVNLEGNVLTLSGHREFKKESEQEGYIYREREEGKFIRSMRLPKPVDEAKITATFQDGVLTVRMPKAQTALKSKITVK